LGNLIENAVKQIELDKIKEAERDADAADDEEALEAELFENLEKENYVSYEDYEEFAELEDEMTANDNSIL
jgi:hypothetical protein